MRSKQNTSGRYHAPSSISSGRRPSAAARLKSRGSAEAHAAGGREPSRHSAIVIQLLGIIFLLLASDAQHVLTRTIYGEWSFQSGNSLTSALKVVLMVVSGSLIWLGLNRGTRTSFGTVLAAGAALLLFVSSFWSLQQELALRQSVAYIVVVAGAIGLARAASGEQLMDTIAAVCTFVALVSLAVWVGTGGHGELRGPFSHKNGLGHAMVAGVIANFYRGGVQGWLRAGVCVIVGTLSQSATSSLAIAAGLTLFLIGALYLADPAKRTLAVAILVVLGIGATLVALNWTLLLSLLGRDATLTGRTEVWEYALEAIQDRPLSGWGYLGFWTPMNPRAAEIYRQLGWPVPNAHNAVLEISIQIGLVGLAVYTALFARFFSAALRCMSGPHWRLGLTSAVLLACLVLIGVSEEVLLSANQIWTAIFFSVGLMCERMRALRRSQASTGVGVTDAQVGAEAARKTSGSRMGASRMRSRSISLRPLKGPVTGKTSS